MTDNVSRLPDLSVVLDLDAEERPEEEVKPPFVVNVKGKKIAFEDPANIDWRDLASVDQPVDLLRVSLSREDRNHLMSAELPFWKFEKLMEGYYSYYDLEDKIREAKRRASLGA